MRLQTVFAAKVCTYVLFARGMYSVRNICMYNNIDSSILLCSLLLYTELSCPTLFESVNEKQKIEPVPIPLPRASRNSPDVKTRNEFFFHNWTSEIIPFIHFEMQMDRT